MWPRWIGTSHSFLNRNLPHGLVQVKIMWPRTDVTVGPGADMTSSRRAKSTGLSGFVSFMKRKDAEQALRELDGFDWGGSILRVGWSKAVPIAQKPMYSKDFLSLIFPIKHSCSVVVGQNERFWTSKKSQSISISRSRKTSRPFFSTLPQSVEPKPLRIATATILQSLSTSG